jgi:hypothetical protein
MTTETNVFRVQKLNEAKDIIAELEEEVDSRLLSERESLRTAGRMVSNDERYLHYMEEALGAVAGIAIRYGHDELATNATDLLSEIEDEVSGDK